jgi:hypothetical protein
MADALLANPEVATPEKGVSEESTTLADARINESSGLARSLRQPGIFWTINDSGGEPCVFALDTKGQTRAKVRLRDAVNIDWEDIAIARDQEGTPKLFVADIGDNLTMRPSVTIYEVPEPEVPAAGETAVGETWSEGTVKWHLAYPGHPRNAEGLFVHPTTRQVFIVTKSDSKPSEVFAATLEGNPEETQLLESVAEIRFPAKMRLGKRPRDNTMATAADISPSGDRLLISTYSYIYEWKLSDPANLANDLKAAPVRIAPRVTRQMEAVAYDGDGRTLWFTSEQLPAPIVRVTRSP